MKPDDEVAPITLIMRKYYPTMREKSKRYYQEHKEEITRRLRERYHNDAEFRQRKLQQRKTNQQKARERANQE